MAIIIYWSGIAGRADRRVLQNRVGKQVRVKKIEFEINNWYLLELIGFGEVSRNKELRG